MSLKIVNFGCRLNIHEAEVMRRAAQEAGFGETAADAIVVNTCAVTSEAVRQARQSIRRLKRENPDARIVVTGCAAQTESATFAGMDEVDRVIGNDDKLHEASWRAAKDAFTGEGTEKVAVGDIMAVRELAPHMVEAFDGHVRAFVQVQNGCDHRCTFCVIPYGRGNSRSVPMGALVDQARTLVERGFVEVVLTGVDLTSYGADLPGSPKLGTLVKALLRHVPELKRLRISSIDSIEADRDLVDVIADDARIMPHLHLSLQAGDDLILKRMKRRHSRDQAITFCRDMRRLRPDIVFGADIIAGFPTETEEMFSRSLALVDECDLTFLHVFPYSPRPFTPAAKMPQVARAAIKERAARLRARGQDALLAKLSAGVGREHSVLAERGNVGHTEQFLPVALQGIAPGALVRLRPRAHDGARLVA